MNKILYKIIILLSKINLKQNAFFFFNRILNVENHPQNTCDSTHPKQNPGIQISKKVKFLEGSLIGQQQAFP